MIAALRASRYVRTYEHAVEAGDHARCLAAIEKAAAIRPEDQEIVVFHAYALYVNRRYDEALEMLLERDKHYVASGGRDRWCAESTGLMGQIHYHLGNFVEARRLVEAALEAAEDLKMHWAADKYFLGLFLLEEGQLLEASKMFRAVEEDEPAFYYQRIQELFAHVQGKIE